jgi:hypothetical protein
MTSILGGSGGGASAVPTLMPKPGLPTVTQAHLPARKSGALPALGLSWVMLDSEICSLKIRVFLWWVYHCFGPGILFHTVRLTRFACPSGRLISFVCPIGFAD